MYQIAQMTSWSRINIHLQNYWAREVLGKFPVMQHLRFGKLFPMSWEPSVDMSRRQLEYVQAPKADAEQKVGSHQNAGRSHMADGFQAEFTTIRKMWHVCETNKAIEVLQVLQESLFDILSSIRSVSAVIRIVPRP